MLERVVEHLDHFLLRRERVAVLDAAIAFDAADLCNLAIGNADVCLVPRRTTTVDYAAIANHDIKGFVCSGAR